MVGDKPSEYIYNILFFFKLTIAPKRFLVFLFLFSNRFLMSFSHLSVHNKD